MQKSSYITCAEDLTVFLRLRVRHQVDAATMAKWYDGLSMTRRPAALRYLLRGKLQQEVLQRLVPVDIAGVGLRVVDRALRTAVDATESLAAVGELDGELADFALRDRITGTEGVVRIAWLRHQTTAYDNMKIARVKGKRREVRRMLAEESRRLLENYRKGRPKDATICPLQVALAQSETTGNTT